MEDKHREAAGKEAARGIRYLEAGFSHSHLPVSESWRAAPRLIIWLRNLVRVTMNAVR